MSDSSEQPLQDVALVGRRWSSGITLSTSELSTLLLLSEEMSGPCFKMEDQHQLIETKALKVGLPGPGPVGGIIKDWCCGPSLTGILNCILLMLILVALVIIGYTGTQASRDAAPLASIYHDPTPAASRDAAPLASIYHAPPPAASHDPAPLLSSDPATSIASSDPAPPPAVCPIPYTMVMGECFYVQNVFTFTFKEAQVYCSAMGGHLAEPKTAQRLLSYQVDELGPLKQRKSYWIGGSDTDGDGEFNWLSGRPVDKTEWQQGMPSETHWDRKCLRYYLSVNQCGVADAKCDEEMNAICEYPLN